MVNMEMEGVIDANEELDYIEFQIFPSRSRYEASICLGKSSEVAASGSLEPLLLHCPQIKALHAKGADSRFKLAAPEDGNGARWFTKSTLLRFLQIVSSSEVLKATTAMRSEISQLEEAHSFQLTLYGKGPQKHFAGEESDLTYYESENNGFPKDGSDAVTSDDSKNELLRAMHLRLTTLREELSNAFAKAAAMTFSKEEIRDIEKLCSLFGATELRKSFCYLVKLSEENCAEINIRSGIICEAVDTTQVSKQSNLPVKYGCSPAKVAEVERQNSSESGESSDSSREEQPSMERSRTLIRSASPRRSASPMRRVQIGRSGSRRSTPLTIKSLSYIPRERPAFQNDDVEQDNAEEVEQPSKKSESNNARRISVQDAISLFESKRRDETSGIQKTKSFSNSSVGPNKSVLRRWSTGIGGASNACQDSGSNSSVDLPPSNLRTGDSRESSPEGKPVHDLSSIGHDVKPTEHDPSSFDHEPAEVDDKPDCPQQSESNLGLCAENDTTSQSLCSNEKKTASAEWSRQKEAELNQLLMKMMETKPVKYKSASHHNGKINEDLVEKEGGLFDRNKEKKNEKFQNKIARKAADKEKQVRSNQLVPDKRNSEMAPRKTNHGGNKHIMDAQKSKKTTSSSSDSAKDILKSSVSRKASSKTPLPATRNSWPSAPTTRSTGISPAKTPPETASAGTTTRRKSQPAPPSVIGSSPKKLISSVLPSAGTTTTTTRRKSQPASPVTGSIPKMLTSQPKTKSLKAVQSDKNKTVNDVNAKNQQPLKRNPTSTKSKTQNVDADSTPSRKPSLYSKVTKKSSVVPLEPKPVVRKGSKVGAAVSSISMTKGSSEADESSKDSNDQTLPGGNEIVSGSSDMVISLQKVDLEPLKDHAVSEQDVESRSLDNSLDTFSQVTLVKDDTFREMAAVSSSSEALDKPTISLTAWDIDEDEHEDQPVNDNICQAESSPMITPTSIPSPRVRYSLSQMLLEETSEPDINEWGSADNPPAVVCQKDAPKGFKKLLKFTRKSKTDANSTGWSSPSVFSEGEDDAEESRSLGKRSSENLLKMATLQAKSYGNQKASFHEKTSSTHGLFGRSNINKATSQSISGNVQDSRNSGSNSQTKATRPFFSLSAFRGSK